MKLAFVFDSTVLIPEYVPFDYCIVPLHITFQEEHGKTTVPSDHKNIYQSIREASNIPKTAQPSPQAFAEAFADLAEKGYDTIVTITMSSELSGTYNSSSIAEVPDSLNVYMIDSKYVSYPIYDMALRIHQLALEDEKNVSEIVEQARDWHQDYQSIICVNSLENLRQSGRMNRFTYLIGSKLHIKPVVEIKNGKLSLVKKIRTINHAIDYAISTIPNHIKVLYILHCDDEKVALEIKKRLFKDGKKPEIIVDKLTPIIGIHGGIGSFALAYRK
ncbi:DegV family protein [Gracilibacillus salinarum]|uniref:DegV family protein n=1 Tax=Gracilibacillus salinarum TaxID=2932255 RepID=A0ABY4GRW9_9BACI|nr:DegV family protein [Gracilibacillus salinarum]UOQ86880.1 DegV family protein [Gracilibacillus salinarum]